jgi:hypothetical protein
VIQAKHATLSKTHLYCSPSPPPVNAQGEYSTLPSTRANGDDADDEGDGSADDEFDDSVVPELIFTENDTNFERLYGVTNKVPYVKDAFHDHIIPGHRPRLAKPAAEAVFAVANGGFAANGLELPTYAPERAYVNPEKTGSKAGAHYTFTDVPGRGGCVVVRLKMTPKTPAQDPAINDEELFDDCIEARRGDADEFYKRLAGPGVGSDDLRAIMRQAMAGMMW